MHRLVRANCFHPHESNQQNMGTKRDAKGNSHEETKRLQALNFSNFDSLPRMDWWDRVPAQAPGHGEWPR